MFSLIIRENKFKSKISRTFIRGIFRTQSNIYNEDFFAKIAAF